MWGEWLTLAASLCTGGGILYLIVEKLFSKKHDTAEARHKEISAAHDAIPLYHEIRAIVGEEVEKSTKPLREELAYIKEHYCCYRAIDCEMRIKSPEDLAISDPNKLK